MDKIWYINPSKSVVIGRCSGGWKKTKQNWAREYLQYYRQSTL